MKVLAQLYQYPELRTYAGTKHALQNVLGSISTVNQIPYLLILAGLPLPIKVSGQSLRKTLRAQCGLPDWLIREAAGVCSDEIEALTLSIPEGKSDILFSEIIRVCLRNPPDHEIAGLLVELPLPHRIIMTRYLQHRQPIALNTEALDEFISESMGRDCESGMLAGFAAEAWGESADELRLKCQLLQRQIGVIWLSPSETQKEAISEYSVPNGVPGYWICQDGRSWFRSVYGNWMSTGAVPFIEPVWTVVLMYKAGRTTTIVLFPEPAGWKDPGNRMHDLRLAGDISLNPGLKIEWAKSGPMSVPSHGNFWVQFDRSGSPSLIQGTEQTLCGYLHYFSVQGDSLVLAVALKSDHSMLTIAQVRIPLNHTESEGILAWTKDKVIRKTGPVKTVVPEALVQFGFCGRSYNPRRHSGWDLHNVTFGAWDPDGTRLQPDSIEVISEWKEPNG